MKVIAQFALFCFFLLAAALVDGFIVAIRSRVDSVMIQD
jgi:hypothetical protein